MVLTRWFFLDCFICLLVAESIIDTVVTIVGNCRSFSGGASGGALKSSQENSQELTHFHPRSHPDTICENVKNTTKLEFIFIKASFVTSYFGES